MVLKLGLFWNEMRNNWEVFPCVNESQTVDHLLYNCSTLNNEREKLIAYISKEDTWPVRENELVNKYLKQFTNFSKSIDYQKL